MLFRPTNVGDYDIGQWIGVFAIAILGIAQHTMRFMSIKLISPTLVSFIRTSEIILAYIIQLTIMNTEPYATSLIGSAFVIIACIGVILENVVLNMVHPKIQWLF